MKTVCVIGLGYIGTPTATILAGAGFNVVGVDVNPSVINSLKNKTLHIQEPGLDSLLATTIEENQLVFQGKPASADYFIITVPTPITADKKPDMQYVNSAIDSIAPYLKSGDCVILESTSPVGSMAMIADRLCSLRSDLSIPVENKTGDYDIALAYCPERILPGHMLHELIHNDRVIGGYTKGCAKKAKVLYQAFVKGECIESTARTASLCKLVENSYRDVNIAFANELSMICDEQGVDVEEVRTLANRHPRVNILKPGVGVGGHCIAVDPWFIVDSSKDRAKLIRCAREVNDYKPHYIVKQIEEKLKGIAEPKILCLGLSYKPNIDDLRESPAVEVVKLLAKNKHYKISVCEPHIKELPDELMNTSELNKIDLDDLSSECFDYTFKLVEHDIFLREGSFNNVLEMQREEVCRV